MAHAFRRSGTGSSCNVSTFPAKSSKAARDALRSATPAPYARQHMRVPVSVIVITFMLLEVAGFVLVGKAIGVLATLGLVLLGMVAGTLLIRHLSLEALRRMGAEIQAGRAPTRQLAEAT